MSTISKNSIIIFLAAIILGAAAFLGGVLYEQHNQREYFDIDLGNGTHIEGWYERDWDK